MSDDAKADKPIKKKGIIGKLMPILISLIVGGAGVGGGLYAMKPEVFAVKHPEGSKEDPDAPKKVKREGGAEGAYAASYFALQQPFTSNLKDSTQFVQLSISLSTFYDEKFVEALKTHEMALRSTTLLTVADQNYDAVATIDGKQKLAALLKDRLNKTLKERGEIAGIDTVYFTSFVVQ
jgi:flagellar protein FliL